MLALLKFQKICVFKISNAYEILKRLRNFKILKYCAFKISNAYKIFMPLKLNILTAVKILNLKIGIKLTHLNFKLSFIF